MMIGKMKLMGLIQELGDKMAKAESATQQQKMLVLMDSLNALHGTGVIGPNWAEFLKDVAMTYVHAED
jgi:flagellar hook-associated protein FlgK